MSPSTQPALPRAVGRRPVRWLVALAGGLLGALSGTLAADEPPPGQGDEPSQEAPTYEGARAYPTLGDENDLMELDRKRRLLEDEARTSRLQPQQVVERLGLSGGMAALEIGAGTGLFTFPIAEAVGPSGTVYATDVSLDALGWLTAESERRGGDNVRSVHVGPGSDDPFYASGEYDLILLASVLEYLPDPVDFFAALRPRLVPGSGRLVLIQGRLDKAFLAEDFANGFRHARVLKLPADHPVRAAMPAELRASLETLHWPNIDDGELRDQLAAFFNGLADEPDLFERLLAAQAAAHEDPEEILPAFLRDDELELWRWLYASLGHGAPGDPRTDEALHTLNYLCLMRWFDRRHMVPRFNSEQAFYLSDAAIEQRMQLAGYRLVDDGVEPDGSDFLPNHSYLVFTPTAIPKSM